MTVHWLYDRLSIPSFVMMLLPLYIISAFFSIS